MTNRDEVGAALLALHKPVSFNHSLPPSAAYAPMATVENYIIPARPIQLYVRQSKSVIVYYIRGFGKVS